MGRGESSLPAFSPPVLGFLFSPAPFSPLPLGPPALLRVQFQSPSEPLASIPSARSGMGKRPKLCGQRVSSVPKVCSALTVEELIKPFLQPPSPRRGTGVDTWLDSPSRVRKWAGPRPLSSLCKGSKGLHPLLGSRVETLGMMGWES